MFLDVLLNFQIEDQNKQKTFCFNIERNESYLLLKNYSFVFI